MSLQVMLTPRVPFCLALDITGRLYLDSNPLDDQENVPVTLSDTLKTLFQTSYELGLLHLGLMPSSESFSQSLHFWQRFAQSFISEIYQQGKFDQEALSTLEFPTELIRRLITSAPRIQGIQYLNVGTAKSLWHRLKVTLRQALQTLNGDFHQYLATYSPASNQSLGTIHFHLVENEHSLEAPFSFWVNYQEKTNSVTPNQPIPLAKVVEQYIIQKNNIELLALLLPIKHAAVHSPLLKKLVETGHFLKPLAWNATQAYQFLKEAPLFEKAGITVHVPLWWNPKHPPIPRMQVSIGHHAPGTMGLNALLDFTSEFSLPSGERLTLQEFESLLNQQEKLVRVKGQWVQVNPEQLHSMYQNWQGVSQQLTQKGLSFVIGSRLLAGLPFGQEKGALSQWPAVAGPWLRQAIEQLQNPDSSNGEWQQSILTQHLKTQLRAYQVQGVYWLSFLYSLKLGGCLADDMGLGKTVQLLALLLVIKYSPNPPKKGHNPHLLIVPASLLGNWQAEIQKFAPTLQIQIIHRSAGASDFEISSLVTTDLVITTYAMIPRLPWFAQVHWDLLILDEAQAIKNPIAQQTCAIKALNSQVRFALTGTPIENRLMDLWSLFDFLAPGLLGERKAFTRYSHQHIPDLEPNERDTRFHSAIRKLTGPYILRRLKSDRRIIQDLPDKTELQTWCTLTKLQAALYQQAVNQLARVLQQPLQGIKRQGIILSYLMRLKQICNHPDQWLRKKDYIAAQSGKFLRLQELCVNIAEKQEKILIFTQFREIIPALYRVLTSIFGQEGLYLHGGTSITKRTQRVLAFQAPQGPPFFILSLKVGGIGLNLTAASHVIHFDRWWNPAVEQQATDRTYRIGQSYNILVHKLICRGTIEEKIDVLLQSKQHLAETVIGNSDEISLTELSDSQLLKVVTLDIHRALGDDEK